MLSYQPGLIIVNRFELKHELGVGGMGIVFGAMDRVLDEEVALKFLPPAMARDREAVEQFAREVKRARKVSGRYVLRVYDIWDDGEGGRFVTMEWARGGDLTAYRRERGLLSWEQVKELLVPILRGLQAVHEAGIVHRDVKPGNILFREEGIPIVADFGISKSIMASMSRISQDATISGTPAYMAPEAIRGTDDIGPATDLYAVGSMAYEMLTGHTPFVGDPMSVMYNQTHSDPSFRDIPVEAVRWLGACLIKDVGKRVQSAGDLLQGLENPSSLPEYDLGAPPVPEPTYAPPPVAPPAPPSTPPRPPRKIPKAPAAVSEQTYKIGARPSRAPTPPRRAVAEPPERREASRNLLPWALGAALLVLVVLLGVVALRGKGGGEQIHKGAEGAGQEAEEPKIPKPVEKPKPDPRAEIIRLEKKARRLFKSNNLTSGPAGSARGVCREIIRKEPQNAVCAELITAMKSKYKGWIESSLRAGDCSKAEGYAASLAEIGGGDAYDNRIEACKRRHAEAVVSPRSGLVQMVKISAGSFQMGSPSSESKRSSDERRHRVTLSRGFWMGKYEVTQEQYEAVMGKNPSYFKGSKRPVEKVSWNDAVEFCNKLSDREGLRRCYSGSGSSIRCDFGANGYRLPTEAEWEYACRAGTTGPFHTGSCLSTNEANYDGDYPYSGCSKGRDRKETWDVGSGKANVWGLYDMHGNVYEWCWDWYGGYPSGSVTDPRGPSSGSRRVRRGGDWFRDARGCRSANRRRLDPGYRDYNLGFRLLRKD